MEKLRLCFVDVLGLKYTGNTLEKRGLGGSESAVISMSRELSKLGVDVTVFNTCEEEGMFDGVRYLSLDRVLANEEYFDIMIISRCVLPYVPQFLRDSVLQQYNYDVNWYENLLPKVKYKVLWLHDTFCLGDEYVESLLVDGYYDELFTLSDWHTHYVSQASHGHRPRRYEVLKKRIYQTRNGINSYCNEVDISAKNPNLFVYNSSVTKGMIPLLDDCWGKIKEQIPDAELTVIGGFYRHASATGPDEQEKLYYEKVEQYEGKNGIHFTGIIKQDEIAEILKKASLMIYPGIFPETFGISTLEAINYNVPLVGCRFGALEEVGTDSTSYLVEYPIDWDSNQVDRFINMTVNAYKDNYLRQQKMYACNAFKPYIGWDSVALQWKQHFYKKLGMFMDIGEIQKVRKVSNNLIKLFGRRHINPEDIVEYQPIQTNNTIVVVSPFYNAENYIENCIRSVASQDYDNYTHYLINDMSTDNSLKIAEETIKSLPENLQEKFIIYDNGGKKCALENQVKTISKYAVCSEDIIVLLDGDDWLINNPDVFSAINNEYNDGAEMTYGSCHSIADNIDLIAQPYPEKVHKDKSYRTHLFNWGMPYTHLRTFKLSVFNSIPEDAFRDANGEYFRAGGDNALFYALLENCEDYHNIHVIQQVLYMYNDTNPLNDYKINAEEQNKNAGDIRKMDMNNVNEVYKVKDEIVDAVRSGDEEAIALYKDIATERRDVWIDDVNSIYLMPRRDWLLEKLNSVAKKESKILDIGSWTGSLANFLYTSDYRDITCVDISKEVVNLGRDTFPHLSWICTDVETWESDKKYDVIIMCEVLEHIVHPDVFIEKAKKWLNPGGCILYTIPSESTVFGEKMGNNSSEHISKISYDYLSHNSSDIEKIHAFNDGKLTYDWYAGSIKKMTNILIAMPTAKNIETDTFLSVYRLMKPDNCNLHFECFYGYRIDQVRNLICHFALENNFDYIFFVDSDIILPPDALLKLLDSKKEFISGVYIQRKFTECIPEIYVSNGKGGMSNILPEKLGGNDIFEVQGCGLGCALVDIKVIKAINYPQFTYHPAIKMEDTVSEDIDFCVKASNKNFKIFVDSSIKCEHIGSVKYSL